LNLKFGKKVKEETNYFSGMQVYVVTKNVVAISPWAVNRFPCRCGGDDV
jgi:hypothetical protein